MIIVIQSDLEASFTSAFKSKLTCNKHLFLFMQFIVYIHSTNQIMPHHNTQVAKIPPNIRNDQVIFKQWPN